jgi:SMC interacting uncharacterized protein involved in chromosome segregation
MIEDHGEYIKKRRKMDEAKLKYINQKMNELKYDAERIKDSISLLSGQISYLVALFQEDELNRDEFEVMMDQQVAAFDAATKKEV